MKYIFLDIDGVLNSMTFERKQKLEGFIPYVSEVDKEAVNRLMSLLDNETRIVISSSWRETLNLEKLKEYTSLPIFGITEPFIPKEDSIINYIKSHDVKNFVIIEDEYILDVKSPLQNHLIKTTFHQGLLDHHLPVILEKLKIDFKG